MMSGTQNGTLELRGACATASRPWLLAASFIACAILLSACSSLQAPREIPEIAPGVCYTNHRVSIKPWSVHIVRMDRTHPDLELRSVHAHEAALGLSTLSEMMEDMDPEFGAPVAAVNADFFQMPGKRHAGDPRGLQIVGGELISAPSGGVAFWLDPSGQPRATNVWPQLEAIWSGGERTRMGLNETRKTNGVILFTPSAGWSTLTPRKTREFILERANDDGPWLPLRVGDRIKARVQSVRPRGNTPLRNDIMVLAFDKSAPTNAPKTIAAGDKLELSLQTDPDLTGVQSAIGGGPMLVRDGEVLEIKLPPKENNKKLPPEFSTQIERHPRTAIGWNDRYIYLVEVDGRQQPLSLGMSLPVLGRYMRQLGCENAMNLDGGGSATVWLQGKIVNSPADEREERPIANALVIVRRPGGCNGPHAPRPTK